MMSARWSWRWPFAVGGGKAALVELMASYGQRVEHGVGRQLGGEPARLHLADKLRRNPQQVRPHKGAVDHFGRAELDEQAAQAGETGQPEPPAGVMAPVEPVVGGDIADDGRRVVADGLADAAAERGHGE